MNTRTHARPIDYGPGILAYVDSFGGLVPCRVDAVDYVPTGWQTVTRRPTVTITADRPGYRRGEQVTMAEHRIIPRAHVAGVGSQSGPTIVGVWRWIQHPDPADAFEACTCPDRIPTVAACAAWTPGEPGEWSHTLRADGQSRESVTRTDAPRRYETLTRRNTTGRNQ